MRIDFAVKSGPWRRRASGGRTHERSDRHDDLAELFVRLQEPVRLDDLVERKDPGDGRLKRSGRQPVEDERLGRLEPRGITEDLVYEVAAERQRLAEDGEEREGGRFRAQAAIFDENATPRHRGRQRAEYRAADRIDHDAYTIPASDVRQPRFQIFLGRSDDMGRAKGEQGL